MKIKTNHPLRILNRLWWVMLIATTAVLFTPEHIQAVLFLGVILPVAILFHLIVMHNKAEIQEERDRKSGEMPRWMRQSMVEIIRDKIREVRS